MAELSRGARRLSTHLNSDLIGTPGGAARLQTPALVVDLDRFDANMQLIGQHCAKAGIALRPHSKTHKSVAIARMQMEAGAVGICCAKLGEAEVMSAGGIRSILFDVSRGNQRGDSTPRRPEHAASGHAARSQG